MSYQGANLALGLERRLHNGLEQPDYVWLRGQHFIWEHGRLLGVCILVMIKGQAPDAKHDHDARNNYHSSSMSRSPSDDSISVLKAFIFLGAAQTIWGQGVAAVLADTVW